ncbi:hypothetical protein FACS1894166_03030 [Bacilli bacterium]|nr:hypothetical protein FACS1894166_03030 [Bacilli bacterium]
MELCKYARHQIKNIAITTDMIVGFPTETQADFNETIKNLMKIKFANIHLFPYSSRPFTVASKMKNVVSDTEKKLRLIKLSTINQQSVNQYLKKFIGKIVKIIFEHSKEKGVQLGHSEYSFTVKVKTKYDLNRKCKMVKVTKLTNGQLFGKLI